MNINTIEAYIVKHYKNFKYNNLKKKNNTNNFNCVIIDYVVL